jgi:hypothetical protein
MLCHATYTSLRTSTFRPTASAVDRPSLVFQRHALRWTTVRAWLVVATVVVSTLTGRLEKRAAIISAVAAVTTAVILGACIVVMTYSRSRAHDQAHAPSAERADAVLPDESESSEGFETELEEPLHVFRPRGRARRRAYVLGVGDDFRANDVCWQRTNDRTPLSQSFIKSYMCLYNCANSAVKEQPRVALWHEDTTS